MLRRLPWLLVGVVAVLVLAAAMDACDRKALQAEPPLVSTLDVLGV